jgi:hypothetical protein
MTLLQPYEGFPELFGGYERNSSIAPCSIFQLLQMMLNLGS